MNPDRFDALSKTLAGSVSRRSALTRGGAGLAASLLALAGLRRSAGAQMNATNWYSVIRRYKLTSSTLSNTEQMLRTGLLPQLSQA